MRAIVVAMSLAVVVAPALAAAQSDDVIVKSFSARAKVCGIASARARACGMDVPARASRDGIVAQARERGYSAAVQDGLAAAFDASQASVPASGCTEAVRADVAETLPMCADFFE